MLGAVWAAFLGLGALSVFGLAVAAFRKWPAIPLYCLTFFAATVWDLPNKPPMAQVAGVSIHYEDVIISVVVASVAVNPAQFWKTVKPYNLIAVLSMVCFGLSLMNGIATFGPNTSVNEFRGFFYTIGMVAWFLNQDWLDDVGKRRFRRWSVVTGIAVSIAAATHIALYGLGKADSFVVSAVSGDEMTSRPLTSDQAMILALLGVLMFMYWGTEKLGRYALLGGAFIGLSVIAQQRSVWVAVAVGAFFLMFRLRGVAVTRLVVAGAAVALVGGIVLLSGVLDDVVQSILYSSQREGTYIGRLDSWTTLIQMSFDRGPASVVFGTPFGFGYARPEYRGFMINYAPHNWYVSIFLRLGLIGLGLFLCVILWALARLWRGREQAVAMGVFVAILVYMWNYSLSWQVGVFFAWALAIAVHTPRYVAERKPPIPHKSRRDREFEAGILQATEQAERRRAKHAAPLPDYAVTPKVESLP